MYITISIHSIQYDSRHIQTLDIVLIQLQQDVSYEQFKWHKKSQVRISVPLKVLRSDGIICKYLPLWVYPMFSMRVYSLFRFVLIN